MSQDRIEFYEQVLELEPGSKLFYTLARLYCEHDDLEKARKVLESGLEKHPEHIQAKLLLASVMERSGDSSAARGVYREIFDRVLDSPEFWSGLAAAFREEDRSEPALAAAFLSSWLAEPSLTWSRVFQNGLDSLKGPDTSSVPPDDQPSSHTKPGPDDRGNYKDTGKAGNTNQTLSADSPDSKDLPEPGEEDTLDSLETSGTDNWAQAHRHEASGQDSFYFSQAGDVPGEEPEIAEHEKEQPPVQTAEYRPLYEEAGLQQDGAQELEPDNISWGEEFDEPEEVEDIDFEDEARTRSMADLLAAQEEYQKALDIYKELWIRSLPGPERQELEGIISVLSQTLDLSDQPDQTRKLAHEPAGTEKPSEAEAPSPEPQPCETSPSGSGQIMDSQKKSPGATFPADRGKAGKSKSDETSEKKEVMSFLSRLAERLDKSGKNHGESH